MADRRSRLARGAVNHRWHERAAAAVAAAAAAAQGSAGSHHVNSAGPAECRRRVSWFLSLHRHHCE